MELTSTTRYEKKKDICKKENKWADKTKEREKKCNKNEKEAITKKRMNRKKVKAQSGEV